jgi:site-specific DNA-methyltransferase (adenine-specific)
MVELCEFAAVKTENAVVYHASNLDVLPLMADNSVDSIVCDPPYELGFMGKSWDSTGIAYSVELWRECLRVLKPGGHILAFGGSRTWHRVAVAIEDAGFELRDSIAWLYGSGFPKSMDIAKAIDKQSGYEGQVIGTETVDVGMQGGSMHAGRETKLAEREIKQLSDEAKQWQGWGTALKPAFEPIVVGRKPLIGTVAANVLEWGVGGLNIDASRIAGIDEANAKRLGKVYSEDVESNFGQIKVAQVGGNLQGRWPANIILDDFTAGLLDEQSGESVSRPSAPAVRKTTITGDQRTGAALGMYGEGATTPGHNHNDKGGASRFFYVAKASKTDRNEGLEQLPATKVGSFNGNAIQPDGNKIGANPDQPNQPAQNFHPTVKPTDLMRYLIKLVTPAGGVVLDPFTGSGSTGKAALLDGYRFVGIEMTADYLPIIEGRLLWAEAEALRVTQAAAEEEEIRLF